MAKHLGDALRASPEQFALLAEAQGTYESALEKSTIEAVDATRAALEVIENQMEPSLIDDTLLQELDDFRRAQVESMRSRRAAGHWLFPNDPEFEAARNAAPYKLMSALWRRETDLRREFVARVAASLEIDDQDLRDRLAARVVADSVGSTSFARSPRGATATPVAPFDLYRTLRTFVAGEVQLQGIIDEMLSLTPVTSDAPPIAAALREAVLATDAEIAPLLEFWLRERPKWSRATSDDQEGARAASRQWAASDEGTRQVTRARWTGAMRIRDVLESFDSGLASRWMDWYCRETSPELMAKDPADTRLAAVLQLIGEDDPRRPKVQAAGENYAKARQELRIAACETLANEATISGVMRRGGPAAGRIAELAALRDAFVAQLDATLIEEEATARRAGDDASH